MAFSKKKNLSLGRSIVALALSASALLGSFDGSVALPVLASETFNGVSRAPRTATTYCGLEAHTHNKHCYKEEKVLSCPLTECEAHTHSASCYGRRMKLCCTLSEGEGHSHTDACYSERDVLACTIPESETHSHSAECYRKERELSCAIPEQPAHTHGSECYAEDVSYICGMENDPSHIHTDACLSADSFVLICSKTEGSGHKHTDACYTKEKRLRCELSEHTHDAYCYAVPAPIVETREEWKDSVADARLNGDWNHDLLEIAKTQLGYGPDGSNYVNLDGELLYYTRYGDWYTNDPSIMYSPWCAMFVSFCLHYAGVEGLPYGCGCRDWLDSIIAAGESAGVEYYHPYGSDYTPKPGDIIFITYGNRAFRGENKKREAYGMEPKSESEKVIEAEHVGILVSMNSKGFRTIEGNNGPVGYHSYSFGSEEEPGDEELILGYVSLPRNPHHLTVTDYSERCSVTGDLYSIVRPYLREPTFAELSSWEQSYDKKRYILGWGVSFVDGTLPYTPTGVLNYSFRFDSLPGRVTVTYLGEKGMEEIPCTVEGKTVSFSTERVGTFIFSSAE